MVTPITSPVVNTVGPHNVFRPLPSGAISPGKLNFVEAFAGSAPPEVLSRTVDVIGAAAPFNPLTPAGLTDVLSISLPVPMPIAVTLGAYSAADGGEGRDRFRGAARFSAESVSDSLISARGRYVIEWGYGKARNYAFTDLAPGSLQIPIADSLRVSAHVYGDEGAFVPGALFGLAGASVYPGSVTKTPAATYTMHVASIADTPFTGSHVVPPFAKEFSAGVIGDVSADMRALVLLNSVDFSTLAAWNIPAPPLPGFLPTTTDAAKPYGLEGIIMPGGANVMFLQLYNRGSDISMAGYTVEVIRL